MSNKSIDGLQRRTSTQGGRRITASTAARRRTVKKVPVSVQKTASNRSTTRRVVGIPDNKKDLKALIAENEELDHKSTTENDKDRESVKEFLSEVKDVDPTDLVEVPKSEKAKGWDKKKVKKEKKEKKKGKLWKKILLVFILLIVAGVVALYFYLNDFVATVTDGGNIINVLLADPDTPLQKDQNGRTNILVFGTEGYQMDNPNYDGGWLTDAMMIISINQDTGDMKAISMPRDLKMERGCTGTAKMNEVYWCEYLGYLNSKNKTEELRKAKEDSAGQKLAEAFEKTTGLQVHYRVHVNWKALIDVINALDGIDVCFYYKTDNCGDDTTHIEVSDKRGLSEKSGSKTYFAYSTGTKYHLEGYQALEVARSRNSHGGYGASGGNFSREYFQQRILEATGRKAKEKKIDLMTALSIKNALGDNIRTNFKDTEIKTLIKLATSLDVASLQTISLQKANLITTGMVNGISYVLPRAGTYDYSAIKKYINGVMTGGDFVGEEAQVVVLNGTAASGIANKEKTTLEGKGYIVSSTGNAPSGLGGFDGVKIYQKNLKMNKTAESLHTLYNVDLITDIPEALKSYEADFIVIVGNGPH